MVMTMGFLSNSRNFDRSRGGRSLSTSWVFLEFLPNNREIKPRF